MAAITSAGSGAWSSAGTWTGGVPVSGDTVTIQAGHTVTFDVDQSGFASGLAGLTINGTLEASTTTGSYYLKMAGNITASSAGGILRAGSSGTPYPSDCLFTIYLNGNYQINCHASNYLTLQLYCYDPPVKYARLISATSKAITGISIGSTTTITCVGHGYSVGNTVWLQDIGGTVELNDKFFEVATVPNANTFTIRWPDPNLAVNSTDYTAWTSGGIVCPQTAEASGQTQIEIDEDVSADAEWTRTGAIVRIDNINRNNQSEAYTISSVSSGYLTLSSSLSNVKYSGSLAILATRNIRVNSSATAISNGMIRYGTGHILRCEIRPGSSSTDGVRDAKNSTISGSVSGCSSGVSQGSGHIISGQVSGCTNGAVDGSGHTISGQVSGCPFGVYSGSGHIISGSVSGCNSGVAYGSGHIISGSVSGCSSGVLQGSGYTISGQVSRCANGVREGSGHIISGPVSECSYGVIYGSGHIISGQVSGCSYGVAYGSGHTISGPVSECSYGVAYGSGHIISGSVSGCGSGVREGSGYKFNAAVFTSNTNDVYLVPDFAAIDTAFGGGIEFGGYTALDRSLQSFAESINHDNTPNAYRAWTRGGIVDRNFSVYPTGKTFSQLHTCESATAYCFQNYQITVPSGGGLIVQSQVRKNASTSYLPRVWILLPGVEPYISGSPSYSAVMPNDSVDAWTALDDLIYTNNTAGPVTLTVRTVAQDATALVYFSVDATILEAANYQIFNTLLSYVDDIESRLTADRAAKLDYLDATISSRLASASYTAAPDAAGIRSAVGLASANLDAQLSTIDGVVDAILADTGTDGVVISAAALQSVVDEWMAEDLESGKTAKQLLLDLWAIVVGDSAADDGDEPTSITYDSPDGSVQRTHAITETTRTVS